MQRWGFDSVPGTQVWNSRGREEPTAHDSEVKGLDVLPVREGWMQVRSFQHRAKQESHGCALYSRKRCLWVSFRVNYHDLIR